MTHRLSDTAAAATATKSNCKMFSRQCLSTSNPRSSYPRSTSSSSASSSSSAQSRGRHLTCPTSNWNGNWNLSLLALIIASGCLMLNTPAIAAFDIGESTTL
ncbi:hypothetical protein KR093_011153 [Drosophila rubida]|uniref:Uncharacterized protein n=1 Tax=Drosophila rubida TaxID=30044 RepID=A0AAD4K776_9MUSC|nr:hypothetical protein KR093_011153 [Drosophila rubida]